MKALKIINNSEVNVVAQYHTPELYYVTIKNTGKHLWGVELSVDGEWSTYKNSFSEEIEKELMELRNLVTIQEVDVDTVDDAMIPFPTKKYVAGKGIEDMKFEANKKWVEGGAPTGETEYTNPDSDFNNL